MSLPVLSVAEIRGIEAEADAQGYSYASMMDDAGRAVAEYAAHLLSGVTTPRISLLIGRGNNGGDGLVAARELPNSLPGAQVRVYLIERREDDPLLESAQARGVFVSYAEDDHDGRVIKQMSASSDLIIDALFGIGVRLPIRDSAQRVLRYVRQSLNERALARRAKPVLSAAAPGQIERPPRQFVLAVDCPSGVDCDTGAADPVALKADVTLTFIAPKPGLFTFPAAGLVGEALVVPLNMPEGISLFKHTSLVLIDNESARALLPRRPLDANKGTFGRVLLVAGSNRMPGAAGLAAKAAYRSGAGLVEVAAPADAISVLQTHLLEAVWTPLAERNGYIVTEALLELKSRLAHADTLVIGPGMGGPEHNGVFVQELLLSLSNEGTKRPVIVDADALNALAVLPNWHTLLPPDAILTPHPGEMARLTHSAVVEVQKDRLKVTALAAAEWQAIVILKGAHTVIAAPDGRVAISPIKTDALAKGGTGDVLAGLLGALRAQGAKPFDAACLAVYLHGVAGLIASESAGYSGGILASAVAVALPAAFARISSG